MANKTVYEIETKLDMYVCMYIYSDFKHEYSLLSGTENKLKSDNILIILINIKY